MNIKIKMFAVFLLIFLAVAGLILYKNISPSFYLTEFETVYYTPSGECNSPSPDVIADAVKLEPSQVPQLLQGLGARVLKQEQVNNITIIYAYSPLLTSSAQLSFGTVNLMIAISPHSATAASPLIYGSY